MGFFKDLERSVRNAANDVFGWSAPGLQNTSVQSGIEGIYSGINRARQEQQAAYDKEKKDAEQASIGYLNDVMRFQSSLNHTNSALNPVDYLRGTPFRPMVFMRPDDLGKQTPKPVNYGGGSGDLPNQNRRQQLL